MNKLDLFNKLEKIDHLAQRDPQTAMDKLEHLDKQFEINLNKVMTKHNTSRIGHLTELKTHYTHLLNSDIKSKWNGAIYQDKQVIKVLKQYQSNHPESKIWLHMSLNWPKCQFSINPLSSYDIDMLVDHLED